MPQSFFVVSGENVGLARDEVIAISKSYDKKTSYKTDSRLVITNSQVPWEKVARRTTFVRRAGEIADTFSDLFSEIDLSLLHKSDTFACRIINLSSKKLDTSAIEKTVGGAIKQISGTRVSLSNPLLTIYLIFTDGGNYFGYAKPTVSPQRPKKVFRFPSELPWKLCRAMINLARSEERRVGKECRL